MYEVAEVFEVDKAQEAIKSGAKENPFVDENGQLFRGSLIDEDD